MKYDYYIMGIGMSAGGLQSVAEFFTAFNPELPLAIILATHLENSHHENLLEILRKKTKMAVEHIQNDTEVQKGKVYVIGAAREAILEESFIRISEPKRDNHNIDTLLSSIAACCGKRSIGMILSGTGTDGAAGLKAISDAGGRVLVQEPFSALYQSLPRLAIKVDHPDKVLPPLRLASWINREIGSSLPKAEP
jgi:chemotaxis response regulator CheB